MLLKPKHKLQDIQYDSIEMRGGSYSYSSSRKKETFKEETNSVATIEIMNDEILESTYHRTKNTNKISSLIYALSFPAICFAAFIYFGYLMFSNINELEICFLFGVLFSFAGGFTVQQMTYIQERMKVNYIAFIFELLKKFDISLVNFTQKRKKQSYIGLLALWSVILNSKFHKKSTDLQQFSIAETIKSGVVSSNFREQLSMLFYSLKIIVQKCYVEEMQNIRNQKKLEQEAKKAKEQLIKEEEFKQVSTHIEDRIKDVYFNTNK